MEQRERDYLLRREADCRRMAQGARDFGIRRIHEELANHYARRLDELVRAHSNVIRVHFGA